MKKLLALISFVFFFVLIVGSVYYLLNDPSANEEKETDFKGNELAERDDKVFPPPIEAEDLHYVNEESFSATIAAVGDILIHESLFKDAYGHGVYDFKPMFENVKDYLRGADIAFANQETMLGGVELGLSGYPQFNSPTEVGDALEDIGIDIVSLANNHTLDVYERGVLNAIDYYESTGMEYIGAYKSFEDQSTIRTIEKNGIIFSFLAYTYGTNGIPIPSGKEYLVNLIDEGKIVRDIEAAKEASDVVVLSMHFGNEYEPVANGQQRALAERFTDAGAHIIFGHHPHVLQPMERVKTENGHEAFVAYSLGNFISGQKGVEREIGGILQLEVEKKVVRNETAIEIKDPRFVPVFTYKNNWRHYKLHELGEIGNDILHGASAHYEQTKAHVSSVLGDELQFTIPVEK